MSETIVELRGQIEDRRKKLKAAFDEAGPDMDMSKVKSLDGDTTEAKLEGIRSLNDELNDLVEKAKPYEEAIAAKARIDRMSEVEQHPGHGDGKTRKGEDVERARKSLGELFVESKAYKERVKGGGGPESELDIEVKTLFATSAGWAPQAIRTPTVVDYATPPPTILDVIPTTTTTQNAVVFMEETTFTNAAAETAEGDSKPEAALALTERTSAVRKIAVWIPVTDEQLEDIPQVQGYLNNRLGFMVRQRAGQQVLAGNGTAPNLRGILNTSGIQTQAKGTDSTPDAIYKALTLVKVTGLAVPNAVVMHPNDWQAVRLLTTVDGIYIWGSPSEAGPARIWGLPVIETVEETENTALVGDFQNFSELAIRRGLEIQISNSHSTYFVENKQAVRAEFRAALVVYRPAAFCKVTGV